jgi:hypothetical protein
MLNEDGLEVQGDDDDTTAHLPATPTPVRISRIRPRRRRIPPKATSRRKPPTGRSSKRGKELCHVMNFNVEDIGEDTKGGFGEGLESGNYEEKKERVCESPSDESDEIIVDICFPIYAPELSSTPRNLIIVNPSPTTIPGPAIIPAATIVTVVFPLNIDSGSTIIPRMSIITTVVFPPNNIDFSSVAAGRDGGIIPVKGFLSREKDKEEDGFGFLKEALISESVLRCPRVGQLFITDLDPAQHGAPAALQQSVALESAKRIPNPCQRSIPRSEIITRTLFVDFDSTVYCPWKIQVVPDAHISGQCKVFTDADCFLDGMDEDDHCESEVGLCSLDSHLVQELASVDLEEDFLELFHCYKFRDGGVWSNIILELGSKEIVYGDSVCYGKFATAPIGKESLGYSVKKISLEDVVDWIIVERTARGKEGRIWIWIRILCRPSVSATSAFTMDSAGPLTADANTAMDGYIVVTGHWKERGKESDSFTDFVGPLAPAFIAPLARAPRLRSRCPHNCSRPSTWRRSQISDRTCHRVAASASRSTCPPFGSDEASWFPLVLATKQNDCPLVCIDCRTFMSHEKLRAQSPRYDDLELDRIGHAFSHTCIQHPPKPRTSRHLRIGLTNDVLRFGISSEELHDSLMASRNLAQFPFTFVHSCGFIPDALHDVLR